VGKVVKAVFIVLGLIIVLAIVAQVVKMPFGGGSMGGFGGIMSGAPAYNMAAQDSYSESGVSYGGANIKLSTRNVSPIIPLRPSGTMGNDAESYEVTDYNARIETRNVEKICDKILELKALDYVIFENASESDRQCSYTFKVEHAHVEEVLAAVKELDPKDLTENTNTIKRQVDDFTSEMEILEKKRDSIDKTLENALRAYDEITSIATRTQNADALAKIIDSKIGIIERLTQERININATLDGLSRAKSEQLDRLKYTYFYVSAYENVYFDWENITDSWNAAFKNLVRSVNSVLQSVTTGLLAFLLWLLPFIVYIFIIVFVGKYGWRGVKAVWQR